MIAPQGNDRRVGPDASERKTAKIIEALPLLYGPPSGDFAPTPGQIWNATERRHAQNTVYGAKFTKAAVKITDDVDQ